MDREFPGYIVKNKVNIVGVNQNNVSEISGITRALQIYKVVVYMEITFSI